MVSALDIARNVFPGEPDESLEYIIWNRTGWPVFWPKRFKTTAGALSAQLKAYRRAVAGLREGERLCEFCNRKAATTGRWPLCRRCAWVLDENNGD